MRSDLLVSTNLHNEDFNVFQCRKSKSITCEESEWMDKNFLELFTPREAITSIKKDEKK